MDNQLIKIRFFSGDVLHVAAVLAENTAEAIQLVKKDYKEFGIDIFIDEVEVISDKGVALTWHEPVKE